MNEETTRALYERSLSTLVGGVNSPVRAGSQPYPEFVERGEGAHVVDVDGNRYLDYVMGYGPLLLGHDLPDPVRDAVDGAVDAGPMYGLSTDLEVELAEFIADHVPSVERLRFVNSGTEATAAAVRLARGATGRDKIVVMQGGYHGGHESFLVEGDAERPRPGSAGVPEAFAEQTIPVPFNDETALADAFERHGDEIAAVITEPLLGNRGIVRPVEGFHDTVRDLCDEYGALFVLDEVITGFRVGGLSCAQGKYDIEPDLTTFAKIVGGGFPVGAIGGRASVMEEFTPTGEVFESGTFNGHPVAMAAGLATLEYAEENDVYERVDALGDRLRTGLSEIVADHAPEYAVVGTDSMFKLLFTRDESVDGSDRYPRDGGDVDAGDTERWRRLFRPAMKDRGILLPPNQFESQFVSDAHTEADVERTLEAYKDVLA
ncbi:glutamate-1-semialdehyde 2,1-aminomutase [Haloterrigena sp. SYSU A558-1]|uniref:Glutamate-1-semialdehyde 2,1-aminomutase n=1 Tax=Haloterrigena gelatinilytica TaxID=2741724 RepID=A0ABX2LGH3_9EURY|nr:glutamate-1-semialdehyde 2,1-aminomutase [Haloterrigena gelatinilytica]NUC74239.1 glutamate-1-semialdehyde 2,1-aminomutase [Haloterrigena gelatinilytica]